jgi:hypothetical protein
MLLCLPKIRTAVGLPVILALQTWVLAGPDVLNRPSGFCNSGKWDLCCLIGGWAGYLDLIPSMYTTLCLNYLSRRAYIAPTIMATQTSLCLPMILVIWNNLYLTMIMVIQTPIYLPGYGTDHRHCSIPVYHPGHKDPPCLPVTLPT